MITGLQEHVSFMCQQQQQILELLLGKGDKKRLAAVFEDSEEVEEGESVLTFNDMMTNTAVIETKKIKLTQNDSQKSIISNVSAQTAQSFWSTVNLAQAPPPYSTGMSLKEAPKVFMVKYFDLALGVCNNGVVTLGAKAFGINLTLTPSSI